MYMFFGFLTGYSLYLTRANSLILGRPCSKTFNKTARLCIGSCISSFTTMQYLQNGLFIHVYYPRILVQVLSNTQKFKSYAHYLAIELIVKFKYPIMLKLCNYAFFKLTKILRDK